ncbi:MAG TPA: hypothetical protein VFV67_33815 [Actinophytocola sp.]|uniref:hypothetical protein n=1 Tax=Actinophytocola sp. TaxID=1872138 RepID=UPI002DBA4684|nr:hypothetical protein [Actinophytocola sp.]HEU5475647.1 hypothetical protein [Actinophytocola sp.]
MTSTPDRRSSGRAQATDEGWRRGFAEPDFEEDEGRRGGARAAAARSDVDDVGPGVFEGVDDHGVITVTVDRSGRVADVVVPPTWRGGGALEPRELGHALCTAANNALLSQLADTLRRLDAGPVAPKRTSLVPPEVSMSEVADLFNRFERDFETYRTRLEEALNVTGVGTGPNGRVTVTMEPGRVVEVTADPRWASHSRHTEIRAEALRAFRSAVAKLGNPDPNAVPLPPSLARLRELARGPVN